MENSAFDFRLASLMAAINENWEDLEATEEDGALVVRVRKEDACESLAPTSLSTPSCPAQP